MTNSSFAISGFGRSGTRFLAEFLDRSPTWVVSHEPTAEYDRAALFDRFMFQKAKGPYGEVNSFLLYALGELPVDHRAVIIRDPLEIVVSAANKGHLIEGAFMDHLQASLATIDLHAQAGVRLVSFERMTRDLGYLRNVAQMVGVDDLEPTADDLTTKINAAGRATLASWLHLDRETRGRIERPLRWFRRRYAEFGAHTTLDLDVPPPGAF